MQLKIAFIAHSFYQNGAEKSLFEFVRHCYGIGIKCTVIGPKSGPLIQDLIKLGVDVIPIHLTYNWSYGIFGRLKQLIKIVYNVLEIISALIKVKPALVYTNTSVIISGAIAAKVLNLPHFWHIHENFSTACHIPTIIPLAIHKRIMERMSSKLIFVSRVAAKAMPPTASRKVAVIYNGIEISRFQSSQAHTKNEKRRICFLGGLGRGKGVDVLLRAFVLLENEHNVPAILDIWGGGTSDQRARLGNFASNLHIAQYVRFMGHTDKVHEVLSQYDVLVVPSRGESFSRVVLEGMAAGIPVVATRCGGPEEIIEDGITGCLVDVEDYTSMARAVNKILQNPDHAETLASEARIRIARFFDLNKQHQKIVELLLSSIDGP